eukprot:TRINITY_DN1310_c0_g2_i1.p1 TRINITY_DN1310_c0_g2~~TRINITY_DN1310_c0_g2_i1.p1  ORF type:complete len:760 (+),score=184.83 TRINITY_DN1310_c0_g2_i1:59-2281(+)
MMDEGNKWGSQMNTRQTMPMNNIPGMGGHVQQQQQPQQPQGMQVHQQQQQPLHQQQQQPQGGFHQSQNFAAQQQQSECCPTGQGGCCDSMCPQNGQSGSCCFNDTTPQGPTNYTLYLWVFVFLAAVAGLGAVVGTYASDTILDKLGAGSQSNQLQLRLFGKMDSATLKSEEKRFQALLNSVLNASLLLRDVTAAPATNAPDTNAPDTNAPATPAPNTPAPDTTAPDTPAPKTPAPDTPAPDTPAPDTPAPDTPAPDTPAPDTAAPDTIAPTPVPECICPGDDNDTSTTTFRSGTILQASSDFSYDVCQLGSVEVVGSGGKICKTHDPVFMMYYAARAQSFRAMLYFLVTLYVGLALCFYGYIWMKCPSGEMSASPEAVEFKAMVQIIHGAISLWMFFVLCNELYFYLGFRSFFKDGPASDFFDDFDVSYLVSVFLIAGVICWPMIWLFIQILLFPFTFCMKMTQEQAQIGVQGMRPMMGGSQQGQGQMCTSCVDVFYPVINLWEFINRERSGTGVISNVKTATPSFNDRDEEKGPVAQDMNHTGGTNQQLLQTSNPSTVLGNTNAMGFQRMSSATGSSGLGVMGQQQPAQQAPPQQPTAQYPLSSVTNSHLVGSSSFHKKPPTALSSHDPPTQAADGLDMSSKFGSLGTPSVPSHVVDKKPEQSDSEQEGHGERRRRRSSSHKSRRRRGSEAEDSPKEKKERRSRRKEGKDKDKDEDADDRKKTPKKHRSHSRKEKKSKE